ncbi:hypothetical protein BGZ89_011398 [Linnemannia elongata]|nr:hypothetical protein BGZ89_011398 [Linnemannia elongata]
MPPHQKFRYGTTIESLAVQRDKITGVFYSRLNDIQETFPGASRFKVDGVIINFLVNEHELRYEPKRIGHYPDEIIDIVDSTPLPQLFQMVQQQNEMLQELAASRAREEQMLREQAESKLREEQMLLQQQETLLLQQQTIDRMVVTQERVEAALIQNYELHEYPIPRLFVVLPDTFKDWDPRNFLMERFWLHFLCECDGDCRSSSDPGAPSGQLTTAATASPALITVRNSIHLAKHEGYELSRPTEFFDRYGPYVLGMLKILRHCLSVATIAAPSVALVDSSVKDIMDGVKSLSEGTMAAHSRAQTYGDSTPFLRNDKAKILGNLYRITTEQGHVKWVCFEHYQERYRATTLASFVQSVETAGGTYDARLSQVTISLMSSTTLKDFFRRLVSQAPAIENLDVTLDWDFGSSDLAVLVDMLSKSNIKSFSLDLKDNNTSNGDLGRLTNILSLCPELVDLRLTVDLRMNSQHIVNPMDTGLHHAIYSLRKLQRLHVVNWDLPSTSAYAGRHAWSDPVSLKELVCTTWGLDQAFVENSIRQSHAALEVLVILDLSVAGGRVNLIPPVTNSEDSLSTLGLERPASDPQFDEIYFSKLTHLDLQAPLTPSSLKYLSSIMPRLNFLHFGCNQQTLSLLEVCNLVTLRSLSITHARFAKLGSLRDVVLNPSKRCQIQSLRISGLNDSDYGFVDIVRILPLQRLHLIYKLYQYKELHTTEPQKRVLQGEVKSLQIC